MGLFSHGKNAGLFFFTLFSFFLMLLLKGGKKKRLTSVNYEYGKKKKNELSICTVTSHLYFPLLYICYLDTEVVHL